MRSAELCQCSGSFDFEGTLKKTSALDLAGSPFSTAMRHPSGRKDGHGPHCSRASSADHAIAASSAGDWACADNVMAVATQSTSDDAEKLDFLAYTAKSPVGRSLCTTERPPDLPAQRPAE